MKDSCSAEVSFPPTYDGKPDAEGSVLLARGPGDITEWSPIFHPGLSGSHRVRWWCHSTTGNFFDIFTWSGGPGINTECRASGGYDVRNLLTGSVVVSGDCKNTLSLLSTGKQGWRAEASRCDSRTDFFRAKLLPNNRLEIVCIQP